MHSDRMRLHLSRKEDLVRDVLRAHPVETRLVCALSCVEPCKTFDMRRNREEKKL